MTWIGKLYFHTIRVVKNLDFSLSVCRLGFLSIFVLFLNWTFDNSPWNKCLIVLFLSDSTFEMNFSAYLEIELFKVLKKSEGIFLVGIRILDKWLLLPYLLTVVVLFLLFLVLDLTFIITVLGAYEDKTVNKVEII